MERREEQEAREEEEAEAEAEGFHERLQKDIGQSAWPFQAAKLHFVDPCYQFFRSTEGDGVAEEDVLPEATSLRGISLDKWFDTAIKVSRHLAISPTAFIFHLS